MKPYWQQIEEIIQESDIILYVLDARLVQESRNTQIEELLKKVKKPIIYVLNKADLTNRKNLELQIDQLKQEGKEAVYVSVKDKQSIRNLLVRIKLAFEKYGKSRFSGHHHSSAQEKKYRPAKADMVVGVIGYPNTGKSSLINSLSFKKKAKVASKAGTTHGVHWIGDSRVKFIDTPGVIPLENSDETRLGLIGSRDPEKMKDKDIVASRIIDIILKKDKSILEKAYNIEIKAEEAYEILTEIGRAKGLLIKHDEVDEDRTSVMIIRDWQSGKIRV